MTKRKTLTYVQKIRWRNRMLWMMLVLMLIYMVVIGEMGGGDSRMQTDFAETFGRIVFFGGMGCVLARIVHNKKLLRDQTRLREQRILERDERNRMLHEKSGGVVLDVLLAALLFVSLTASMFSMAAFYTAVSLLFFAAVLKLSAYLYFSRMA